MTAPRKQQIPRQHRLKRVLRTLDAFTALSVKQLSIAQELHCTGTYKFIHSLQQTGHVQVAPPPSPDPPYGVKYYALTDKGRAVARKYES